MLFLLSLGIICIHVHVRCALSQNPVNYVYCLFCRGGGVAEDAPVNVSMHSFGGNVVVLALCRDVHLRLWATEVRLHVWLPSACMRSKGTVVVLSVCLSVCLCPNYMACSKFIHSTNDTTYLMHNKGVKFCRFFTETALLQSLSSSCIVWLLHKEAIFPLHW